MNLFGRKRFENDMETELRFHVDAYIEDLVRRGVERGEAVRRARLEFGAMEAAKDECRQAWGLERLDELRADLRYTLRTLRTNPAFAAIAILSLGLGIGANTAIFGLVDAVLLRALPVRDPGSLVFLENAGTEGNNGGPPYPCFELLRDRATSFQGMAAWSGSNMEVGIDAGREMARGVYLSGNYYSLLGVKAAAGRTLSAADDQIVGTGGPDGPVVVISRAYWRNRFGGSAAAIGRSIRVFDFTARIVGVMPDEGMSPDPGRPVDIAVPMMLSDAETLRNRGAWWLEIIARLKPGVSVPRARAESDALFQGFMADSTVPPDIRKQAFDHMELEPAGAGSNGLRNRFGKPLTALVILAGLVLLAACVTVANLMVARASARQKEFAVRLAIGAGRGRLVRQTLTEALVLVGAGAALGIVLAQRGEAALAAYFAEGNNKIVLDLALDGRLLLFTLAISALTGMAFGVLPALRAVRVDPAMGMQGASRSVAGSRSALRLGRALVVLQVGLSMVLLASAGLFLHSLRKLEQVDLGFDKQGVLTMDVTPEHRLYGSAEWRTQQDEILSAMRSLPGVKAASWSTMTPLNGRDRGVAVEMPGFTARTETDKNLHLVSVSPEYLSTMGATLVAGRTFGSRDQGDGHRVAILNETAARFYFGNQSPVGRVFRFTRPSIATPYEIAGVVKDAKHKSVRQEPERFVYLPVTQSIDKINRLTLVVRTSGNATALAAAVMRQVRGESPTSLIGNISTIEKQVDLSLMKERMVSALATAFGVLALVLACIGLYGVLAYTVTRRTSEMGIRMALGATGSSMVRLVLGEAIALTAGGMMLGVLPALQVGRVSRTLLFGVESLDLVTLGGAMAVLLLFAAFAGVVPARRAGRLDPVAALRCE